MASYKTCNSNRCRTCAYDPEDVGSWRSQVESCRIDTCKLFPVRPVTMETIILRRAGNAPDPNPMNITEKAAGDAYCKDCIYDANSPGSWRSQVEACSSVTCDRYSVRPVTMELMLARRQNKSVDSVDLDALVAGMDDEEESTDTSISD